MPPAVAADLARLMLRRGRALRQFVNGALNLGPLGGGEPELRPKTPNLAQILRAAGYEVAYRGKWHLTQPDSPEGWSERDAELLEERFGFAGWDFPDAAQRPQPDADGDDRLPGAAAGAPRSARLRQLLQPPAPPRRCQGRPAAGRARRSGRPGSLRSRTVVVRCSDHGEMGLSHGGLRQKAFNAYEETIAVPLIVSNPLLFPRPAETGALASLIDLLPTVATLGGAAPPAGAQGVDLGPVLARHAAPERAALERSPADFRPLLEHPAPADSVRDNLLGTPD